VIRPLWRLRGLQRVGVLEGLRQARLSARGFVSRGEPGGLANAGVHPLRAHRHHVDIWVRHLSEAAQPATGRPASPASIARRLSCL